MSLALLLLRSYRGWTQKELARASGIPNNVISDYETGRRTLPRERLDFLVAVLGWDPETVDISLAHFRSLSPEGRSKSPLGPTEAEYRSIRQAASLVARVAADTTEAEMSRSLQAERAREARREAEELWERLKRFSPRERRVLVEGAREFQTWALCERICAESERAAAADANRALELADLALRVATRVSGEDWWRSRIQGYAWAFVGNARRVAGDLAGSDEAFARMEVLGRAAGSSVPDPLDEPRVLDLQASLRKHQGRFAEALDLHERALALMSSGGSAYILLNMAFTQEQMGEHERAIKTLKRAAALVDEKREPRLLFALRFNLAVNLCHLGRQKDAVDLVPGVRSLAIQLGNELDLLRVLWLEGRVSAALGELENATAALEQVRDGFASRGIAYDMALVSLELATLHLRESRLERVKALARQMAPVFRTQGVHREALAALRLFCEAVERERATADMAQRLLAYLQRARNNPQLRFEE